MTTHPIARPPAEARAAAAPAGTGHTATTGIETQKRPPVADTATTLLPYEPQSAAAARRLLRTTLHEWQLGDLVEAGELIVSELANTTSCGRRPASRSRSASGGISAAASASPERIARVAAARSSARCVTVTPGAAAMA